MNVRGMRIMDSRGVFNGGFGAQVVPVADDAVAAQAVLERLSTPVPAPAEQPQETKEAMPDPVLTGLLKLNPKNPERRAERDALVSERMQANERARALIEIELREDHSALVQQHAECRARGRAQEKIVTDVLNKLAETQQEINRLDAAFANRRTELETAKQERAGLPRFATDDQIAQADAAVRKAQSHVEKASQRHAQAVQERNRIVLTALPPEQKKLSEIVVELNRLEALLSGASAESAERLEFGFLH